MVYSLYAILVAIGYQDFKERKVYWWLFLGLAIFAVLVNHSQAFSWDTLYNLSYLSVLAFGTIAYLILRNGSVNIEWNQWMGLGDVLFFVAITPLFPFQFFIMLIPLGFVIVLIAYAILNGIKKQDSLPLAGLFALVIIGVRIFQVPLMQWFGITQYYVA